MGKTRDDFITAVKNKQAILVTTYLASGVSPNAYDEHDRDQTPALMIALQNHDDATVNSLLMGVPFEFMLHRSSSERPLLAKIQIQYGDKNETTPIMLASKIDYKNIEIFNKLLALEQALPNQDKTLNKKNNEGKTALYYAALHNNGPRVKALIAAGADPNLDNLLMTLVSEGQDQAATCLLNNAPAHPQLKFDADDLLKIAFERTPTLEGIVDYLVMNNEIPIAFHNIHTLKNSQGCDLLSWAIQRGHYDFATKWINEGAIIPTGNQKFSPMKQLVNAIIETKDFDPKNFDTLTALLRSLIDNKSISQDDLVLGRQCLAKCLVLFFKIHPTYNLSTHSNNAIQQILRYTSQGKADLNYIDSSGVPLIIQLTKEPRAYPLLGQMLRELKDININAKDKDGTNALLYALKTNDVDSLEVVVMLIKRGAKVHDKNIHDESAFDYIMTKVKSPSQDWKFNHHDYLAHCINALAAVKTDFNKLIVDADGYERTGLMHIIQNYKNYYERYTIGKNDYMSVLIRYTDLDLKDSKGETVATWLAKQPNLTMYIDIKKAMLEKSKKYTSSASSSSNEIKKPSVAVAPPMEEPPPPYEEKQAVPVPAPAVTMDQYNQTMAENERLKALLAKMQGASSSSTAAPIQNAAQLHRSPSQEKENLQKENPRQSGDTHQHKL